MIGNRTATLADLRHMLDWAAAEGWNPGREDAEAFFAADPQGFYVAVDAQDAPVAAISVVNHTEDFAFLGLYIVRPERRGQGIGHALWRHALDHAGDRVVGLDGVEAQQANYAASGFVPAGGTTRYSGHVDTRNAPQISVASVSDLPGLIAAEAAASGVAKPAYLTAWFTNSATRQTIILRENGHLAGVCTVRACRDGAKIGPLVAQDTDSAARLIRHAAAMVDGPITLDVPDAAQPLAGLCRRLGLVPGFRTARMYRGRFDAPAAGLFAVSSLELG